MEVTITIPVFVCWATSATLQREPLQRLSLVSRVLRAFTAADAIAQAELELRRLPELRLVRLEPFDPAHHRHLLDTEWYYCINPERADR